MASTENSSFAEPRECRLLAAMKSESRDDLFLVAIEPTVVGQGFDLGACDIDHVVIAARLEGRSLDQLQRCWPVPVYVLLMLAPYVGQVEVRDDDLRLIAWAEVYPSESEFVEHAQLSH